MAEWTKLDQRRADFVAAAIAYFRQNDKDPVESNERYDALQFRWLALREVLDGKAENAALDPERWCCPHCGKDRPGFNWQLCSQIAMGIGSLTYFNIFCAEEGCRKLIQVAMVKFIPEAALIDEARKQMNRGGPTLA
jgi:hypothetical protein